MASTKNGVMVPAIGEIKAATETVGPTFALVQSLMYTAQLVTRNQFLRLKKHYCKTFAGVDPADARNYDLAIDTARIGSLDKAVDLILSYLQLR